MHSESVERSERRAADGTELSAAQTEGKRRLFQLSHLESELVKALDLSLSLIPPFFLTFKQTLSTKKCSYCSPVGRLPIRWAVKAKWRTNQGLSTVGNSLASPYQVRGTSRADCGVAVAQ